MKSLLIAVIMLMGWSFSAQGKTSTSQAPESTNVFMEIMNAQKARPRKCRKINVSCWTNAQCCSGRCARFTYRCRPVGGGYTGPLL